MVELNTAIVWFASLQIRDWLHSVPDQRHFRQRVHHTMCVLSISLELEYLSFSAEWLENTSLLRGTGSRPPSHCTEVSPLLCIIDTTATGCSEMLKFCYIAPHPRHTHTLTLPPNAKCKFKRESWYSAGNHPVFSLPPEKLWWLSWSPWKQHDSEGSLELLFKLNRSEKTPQSNPSGFLFSVLFGICGCVSVSTATLLMQTGCCLRLVYFLSFLSFSFFFFGRVILSLRVGCFTVLQRVLFSQWPYSVLFYSMHKTVFVYLSTSLLLLRTRLNECPSFSVLP